jgi:hypothetical protein
MSIRRLSLTVAGCLLAAAAAAPAASAAGKQTVTCKGSGDRCVATISLAGGASNERVVIRLTDTDLKLVSVKPSSRSLRQAYDLSHGRFRLGGSEYVVTLSAVQSIGPRGKLRLTFAAADANSRTVTCKGSGKRCTATIPLAGGITGERITVRLPDTDLQLIAAKRLPSDTPGSFFLDHGRFKLGGSEYVVRLGTSPLMDRHARLRLTFAPEATVGCGRIDVPVPGEKRPVRTTDVRTVKVSCATAGRVVKQCINATGPGQGWWPSQVGRYVVLLKGEHRVEFQLASRRGQTCVPTG